MLLMFMAATAGAAPQPADTVALNGKIYTMNEKQPWAEATAIKGQEIGFVGERGAL